MDFEQELAHNRISLAKCKKVYNVVSIIYLGLYGVSLFGSIYFMILSLFDPSYFALIIINAGVIFTGFMGAYKKNDLFAALAPLIALIDLFFSTFAILCTPIAIACGVCTIIANRKYRWLEKQYGFPYFNSRFINQVIDRDQWNIKDPYTQQLEELKKNNNNSGKMDEL